MKKYLIIAILILAALTRLPLLSQYPMGLNSDEAAIGYNAYSMLQTGKDEHGAFLPLVFRSFDDYKPPLYFYLCLPFVKLLGLTPIAVRLPSALIGIASVYLLYLLIKRVKTKYTYLPHLSALALAILPLHIHFSRGGWEVNASTFFILLSIYFLEKSIDKSKYIYLFGLTLIASLYTYHSARIIAPLISFAYFLHNFTELKSLFSSSRFKHTITAIVISLALVLPLASQMLSEKGQSRFSGVSIFADQGPAWQATDLRNQHSIKNVITDSLHNRYLSYGIRFVENYLSHFSPDFLFFDGDTIARSKTPETGQALLSSLPLFVIGLLSLFRQKNPKLRFFLSWLFIAPIAASLTYQSPHALRAQNISIPLAFTIAFGFQTLISQINSRLLKIGAIILVFLSTLYCFSRYTHMYLVHAPKVAPYAWQYGFSEISSYLIANQNKYDQVIITTRYDQPYILIAFFTRYDPNKLQQELMMTPPDQYGFSTGASFGKYRFRPITVDDFRIPRSLIIVADEKVESKNPIYTVKSPLGDNLFSFYETP